MDQTAFAELIDTNTANISRYVKRGVIKGYGPKNKVKREEALAALMKVGKLSSGGKFLSRKSKPFEANEKLKQDEKEALLSLEGEIETTKMSDEELKEIAERQMEERKKRAEEQKEEDVHEELTLDLPEELSSMLAEVEDPSKRMQMIKDFWTGKIQRQKFMREKRELIHLNDAKAVIEILFHPISKKLDNFHVDMKARFPEMSVDALEWVAAEINAIKRSVQEYQWDS